MNEQDFFEYFDRDKFEQMVLYGAFNAIVTIPKDLINCMTLEGAEKFRLTTAQEKGDMLKIARDRIIAQMIEFDDNANAECVKRYQERYEK